MRSELMHFHSLRGARPPTMGGAWQRFDPALEDRTMDTHKKQKKAAKRTATAISSVARRSYAPEVQPKIAPSPAQRAEMSRDVRVALDALTLQGLGSPALRAPRGVAQPTFPVVVRRSTARVSSESIDLAPFICG